MRERGAPIGAGGGILPGFPPTRHRVAGGKPESQPEEKGETRCLCEPRTPVCRPIPNICTKVHLFGPLCPIHTH
jgi:hypothetical protein